MTPLLPIALLALAVLGGCAERETDHYQGYAEGEYVRIAAPIAGRLLQLNVQRGSDVSSGAPLFTLEQENEAAARREAEERMRNAQAQLDNLTKSRRAPEIDAVRAQLAQAQASLKLSEASLQRQEKLAAVNFVSKERVDEARASFERDRARVAELSAQVTTARLPARQDEIRAAEFNVRAAKAALEQAAWRLQQKTVNAPIAGIVADTNYVLGEWVAAGAPVLSLLPPQNIKVRFFVPEPALAGIKVGQSVQLSCDGCRAPQSARVSFISPQAEFTPPVIYSRESRAKLVFLIEARAAPDSAVTLHPGQPLEVRLAQ